MLQGLDELPFLIWADRQTLGRGRGENQWWSDEGSLTFTIALDPAAHSLRIDQEPRLALMTAAAVIEAIGALGLTDPGIGIRWPNDIEVNGRKLGGVLPERVETRQGHRLLIGIGLNVLTRIDQAPPDVQRMATSLSALQLQPLEPSFLSGFLAAILTQFERALYWMAADDPGLAQQWDRLNLLRDQVVRVALGPRVISGKVHEIDAQGRWACTTASKCIACSVGTSCAIPPATLNDLVRGQGFSCLVCCLSLLSIGSCHRPAWLAPRAVTRPSK